MKYFLAILGFLLAFLCGTLFVGTVRLDETASEQSASRPEVSTAEPKVERYDLPTPPPMPSTVSGGILNDKAKSLPAPDYPAAAKAVRASGRVAVQILVVKDGRVVSATAVSGHPLLRFACEKAARKAVFDPTLLSGVPVSLSGVLVYDFPK